MAMLSVRRSQRTVSTQSGASSRPSDRAACRGGRGSRQIKRSPELLTHCAGPAKEQSF